MRYLSIISLSVILFVIPAFGQQDNEPGNLALYYGWLEKENRDKTYLKAYRDFVKNGGERPRIAMPANGREAKELAALSASFTESFWIEKDYKKAFYIGFWMEDKLQRVDAGDYPDKWRDYFKLGEAYYLFLDNRKSIDLLMKALPPEPISFADQTNLNALKIIGICYANMSEWTKSDNAFRTMLLSDDVVLDRPVYNAYAISHLGYNAMLTGRYDLAIRFSEAVWPVLRQTDNYGHLAGACFYRGRSYLRMGDFKQASVWIDSLFYFARREQHDQTKRIKQAYLLKSDYYTVMGDTQKAKVYTDSLVRVYKAIEAQNISQYIVRAAQQYGNERIATKMAKLDASHVRTVVIAIVALLSIAVALVAWLAYRRKNAVYAALAARAIEWAKEEERVQTPMPAAAGNRTSDAAGIIAPTADDRRIMALVDHEMTHLHAYREIGLTGELLADRLGIHRNTLSRVVNRITGSNVNTYLNGFRIREAVRIISATDRKQLYLEELYERVGFGNRTSFYRAFKQFTRLSPIEFQKKKDSSLFRDKL